MCTKRIPLLTPLSISSNPYHLYSHYFLKSQNRRPVLALDIVLNACSYSLDTNLHHISTIPYLSHRRSSPTSPGVNTSALPPVHVNSALQRKFWPISSLRILGNLPTYSSYGTHSNLTSTPLIFPHVSVHFSQSSSPTPRLDSSRVVIRQEL
jgi:hypothetical protein